MQALARSFTLLGVEAIPVQVEVSLGDGYPVIAIVGLPGKAVRESLERIQAAFHGAGFKRPDKRVTVNLAPAELRKDGAFLDLAIALGILAALKIVPAAALAGRFVAGELSLTGEVRPVRGVLAMALAASRAPGMELMVPQANVAEARAVAGLRVGALRTLVETVGRLQGTGWEDDPEAPAEVRACPGSPPIPAGDDGPDLADIRGQAGPRRALEIAAAGGHNLLFFGPPGAGKTLLAQRLPGILPALTREESLEASLVHSVAGLLPPGTGLLHRRPFRAPHHTISGPGLVGGGTVPRPGEVSLAHGGVLFLDEMPEFRSPVLNLLRQPLEDGVVRIVRSGCAIRYPCRSMLVGAMNPCMCGFLGHPRRPCRCTPHQIRAYRNRLSGPLLDRIDMHVEVPAVTARELTRGVKRRHELVHGSSIRYPKAESATGESEAGSSASIRSRVVAARRVQEDRLAGELIHCNAQMGVREIERHCRIDDATRALLHKAMETRSMSARGAHRVLRVARTIADLAGEADIGMENVAEALQYQSMNRAGEYG